eukprot:m.103651 g.103651  ORF g.103651 m.103651 type:complete len:147 (-) comp12619_c0_seq2:595-1035(-)
MVQRFIGIVRAEGDISWKNVHFSFIPSPYTELNDNISSVLALLFSLCGEDSPNPSFFLFVDKCIDLLNLRRGETDLPLLLLFDEDVVFAVVATELPFEILLVLLALLVIVTLLRDDCDELFDLKLRKLAMSPFSATLRSEVVVTAL